MAITYALIFAVDVLGVVYGSRGWMGLMGGLKSGCRRAGYGGWLFFPLLGGLKSGCSTFLKVAIVGVGLQGCWFITLFGVPSSTSAEYIVDWFAALLTYCLTYLSSASMKKTRITKTGRGEAECRRAGHSFFYESRTGCGRQVMILFG